MKLSTMMVLLTSLFILSACGGERVIDTSNSQSVINPSVNKQQINPEEASYEEHLDFERQYSPIVSEEMKKLFPTAKPHENPFERLGTYYIDTSNKNNMKYVFLVDQEDAQEMKDLTINLKAQMGDHVEFRKSMHTQLELKAISEEIVNILQDKKIVGGWGVSVDVTKEKVVVDAYLDDTVKSELVHKFGADLMEVQMLDTGIGLVGYVVDKKEGKILVVDPNVRNKENYFYAATWYSNAPTDIEIGQKVEVTVVNGPRTLLLQYPDRDEALEVKVIQIAKVEGAVLAEEEAIRKALTSEEYRSMDISKEWLPVVKEVKYDAQTSNWTVLLTNKDTETVLPFLVKDRK